MRLPSKSMQWAWAIAGPRREAIPAAAATVRRMERRNGVAMGDSCARGGGIAARTRGIRRALESSAPLREIFRGLFLSGSRRAARPRPWRPPMADDDDDGEIRRLFGSGARKQANAKLVEVHGAALRRYVRGHGPRGAELADLENAAWDGIF